MKKYFLILIVGIIFNINVNALTYYGEYTLLEDISLIDNYKSDELLIEEIKFFNTYKETFVDMGYLLDNDIYIKDELDYIEEYALFDEYIIGYDEYVNLNSIISNLMYIRFINIPVNYKIYEILVYYNNELVGYDYFYNNFKKFLDAFDGNYDTYNYSTYYNNYINLVFRNDIILENLKIVIYTEDKDVNFDIMLNSSETKNVSFKGNVHTITFNNSDQDYEYKYGNIVRKNKYYKLDLLATNNYVLFGDNLLLDDYIINYNYYVRSKFILKDNIVIDNRDVNLYDFIEYSNGNVSIYCNIDYFVNGEYYCNFILNDINVDSKVIVDIKDNIILEEDVVIEDNIILEEDVVIEDNIILENDIVLEEVRFDENIEQTIIDENKDNILDETDNVIKDSVVIEELKDTIIYDDSVVEDIVYDNSELDNNRELVLLKDDVVFEDNISSSDNVSNKKINIKKYIIISFIIVVEFILFIKRKKSKSIVESI